MDGFVSVKSKNLFSRLYIDRSFLQESVSSLEQNELLWKQKKLFFFSEGSQWSAERAVKLMQNFHGKIAAKEEQKQYLLRCVQEHRKLYLDCKKKTLIRKYSH